MKSFAYELFALGKPIEDDELLGYLLHGLDKTEYNPLITSVNANPGTTLEDFFEQLGAYDMRNGVEENGNFISSANLARRAAERDQRQYSQGAYRRGGNGGNGDYRVNGDSRDRRDERRDTRCDDNNWRRDERDTRRDDNWRRDERRDGENWCRDGDHRDRHRRDDNSRDENNQGRFRHDRAPMPYVNTTCQICKIHGHSASDCWWRNTDDKNESEKAANLASYGVDINWYPNTSTTDHITSELNKILIANKYYGQDQVRTAEGTGMHISHIGHSVLRTPHVSFDLKNILHVPSASKNLLSVHKFTLDNHVFIEFHPFFLGISIFVPSGP
jgi:hypothetical protein